MTTAFDEGYAAAFSGRSHYDNPYVNDETQYYDWNDGWDTGNTEYENAN